MKKFKKAMNVTKKTILVFLMLSILGVHADALAWIAVTALKIYIIYKGTRVLTDILQNTRAGQALVDGLVGTALFMKDSLLYTARRLTRRKDS